MRLHHLALLLAPAFGFPAALATLVTALPSAAVSEVAPQAPTEAPATIAGLSQTLMIGPVIEVMREEGMDYGGTLEAELFPGGGGARWQAVVGLIYDTGTMRKRFDAAFAAELGQDTAAIEVMQAFFGSEQGQRILSLEIEARRALMDEAAEEAAKIQVEDMIAEEAPRMEMLRRFADTNDLIESNVAGALTSNLAFFKGMSQGGAFDEAMTEEQMLSDVWSQEAEIRQETTDWLFPYLALAYGPLPDSDLEAYLAFSETEEGQRLNAAVFAAFNEVFTAISYDLGRAAAKQMQGEDI